MRAFFVAMAVFGGLLLSGGASAHHSQTMYEEIKQVTLEGEVTRFAWLNPHTWIFLNVTDENGKVQEWKIESFAAASLKRRGWSRDQMKPGDIVTVVVSPRKDGGLEGELNRAILATGEVLVVREIPPRPAR